MGTITFVGGSEAQQQAIRTAHTALMVGLPAAAAAAAAGGSGFASWFGAAAGQTASVTGTLQLSAVNLAQQNFTYDLASPLAILPQARIRLMFTTINPGSVTAQLWDDVWSTYYLDRAAGAAELTLSILHELVISFNPAVIDILGVDDAAAAQALAAVDPRSAAASAANIVGYVSQFLSGISERADHDD